MTVGEKIRDIRVEKGMTQKELGEALGVSVQTISAYESGRRRPKVETLSRFADALGVPYSEFFGLDGAESDYQRNYQQMLDLALKASMNKRGKISLEKLLEGLKYNSAEARYSGMKALDQKTDRLYTEELEDIADSELRKMVLQSFDELNRVGKIEAVKRLAELGQLPRYSAWSKKVIVDQSYLDDLLKEEEADATPPGDAQTDPDSPKEE